MSKWTYNLDGDPLHPDWEHTLDGDYRPKNATYTLDGDLVVNGRTTSQEQLDRYRRNQLEFE